MIEDLQLILQDECHIHFNHQIVIGVSGGPDSLCIMDVLDRIGYQVVVAHFNHKLRPSSDDEAQVVRKIAQERGLQIILGEGEVAKRVEQQGESIEEAARNERYQFLFASAARIGAQGVVVGHTADDQVETVLMHLLRGAGMAGLSGMRFRSLPNPWSTEMPLLRPLLSTWRVEILEYCQDRELNPIFDASNEDTKFYRNRLRHELIPYLETYNPAIRKLILRTAQVMRGESDLISEIVSPVWKDCLLDLGEGCLAIDPQKCSQQPLSLQRHIFRKAIAELRPGLRDISFNAIEIALEYLQPNKPYMEVDLTAGLRLVSEPGKLWFAKWEVDIPSEEWPQIVDEASELDIGGYLNLKSGWKLSTEKLPVVTKADSSPWEDATAYRVWIDYSQVQSPLLIRARRDGDRFQPHGLDGHSQKLSDFMINEKMPKRARDRWPLVCSGEKIVWVPGYRLAHPFRVTASTTEMVNLSLTKEII